MKDKNLRLRTGKTNTQLTEAEVYKLLHKLEIHQVELELQNEELLLAKEKASIASEKYIGLYDFAPIGYFTLSPEGEILELNLAGAKMLGKDRSRLKNKIFGKYVSDDTITIFSLFLERVFSSEVSETCEVTLATIGNPPMYVQLFGIKSQSGEPCNISAVNITGRKQAEEKIRAEQAFRNSIGSSLSSGIAVVDDEGRQIYVNPSFCKMFGWSAEELIGETAPYVYWPTDQLQAIGEAFQLTLAYMAPTEGFDLEFVHKDGVRIPVQVIIAPFYDGKKRTGWLSNVIDITKRKKAEEEVALKNEELQKLNATKDKFFSIIAHDLRSPFNSIVGFSELLLEQISKKEYEGVENYAQIIKKSSGQAIRLLMNLMEWSQSQTGRMVFNPEYFELLNIINEVDLLFLEIYRQKEIIIRKILPHSATVYADKNMISTVLRNLFSNAVKFSHPGGTITISVKVQQNELTISISDTGVGIAKKRIDKLFLIDENYSTPGTHNEKGTGLGLILCKEFVDKNGGKIWTESIVGEGSTFYFTLPRQEKSDEKNVIQYEIPAPAIEIWMNKLKILIVEDDEESERLLAIQVKMFGEEVLEAVTGVEAVDICRRNPDIDLILMDIQLPEMDGYEATRQIREFNKTVIILALTAYGFDGDREKANRAGCNDYYAKPVSKDELTKMIQKIFKKE